MILTGPEIRRLIDEGKEHHGKEYDVAERAFGYTMPGMPDMGTAIDDSMNYIHVDPYDPELVGPNSVDLRLGNKLLVYRDMVDHVTDTNTIYGKVEVDPLDMRKDNETVEIDIPEEGIVLRPRMLYLGRTIECIGSNAFVPIVEGRSSVGRLGIHVHVTAGFCDVGFKGTITLEIHVIHPVRVYPNVPICQAYFLKPEGAIELYKGRYQDQVQPTASRFSLSKEEFHGK